MLFVLSPAKSLDYQSPLPRGVERRATQPRYLPQAAALMGLLSPLTPVEVARLMDLSDALAQLNVGRYAAWSPAHDAGNSRPAMGAFDGDVYDGLDARSLGAEDWAWAQDHVLILSGLYGLLRPLDRLQPYRLEMGTRLANPQGKDLYAFWGDVLAQHLHERLAAQRRPVLVNLASQEYFKAIDRPALHSGSPAVRVVDCRFEDWKAGRWQLISFFAKRARGAMARWAIEQRVDSLDDLTGFDRDGYAHAPEASTTTTLVFRRQAPPPARAQAVKIG